MKNTRIIKDVKNPDTQTNTQVGPDRKTPRPKPRKK